MIIYKVFTSEPRPERAKYVLSVMGKIRWYSVLKVSAWTPKRLSEAIATQFLPFMAIMADPLYSCIDCIYHVIEKVTSFFFFFTILFIVYGKVRFPVHSRDQQSCLEEGRWIVPS